MTSIISIAVCLYLLLAAVTCLTIDASADADDVGEIAEIFNRHKRQAGGHSHSDCNMEGRPTDRSGPRRRNGRRGQHSSHCRSHMRGKSRWRVQRRWQNRMSNGDIPRLNPEEQRFVSALATSQNMFTSTFHKEIGRREPDIVYSPYSIHQVLTMTSLGAKGETASQMNRVLSLQDLKQTAHRAYRRFNMLLNNAGNATVETANAVYVKPGANIERQFSNDLTLFYNSSITPFDFQHPNGPEAPINEWVSTQTHNLIPSILGPGTITPMTAMVLVNAIYFKAKWKTPFGKELTSEQMFRKTLSEQVPVQMMTVESQFKMSVVPGHAARVLELQYEGDRFSLLVILPDDVDGLATIEEGLTAEDLSINLDRTESALVKVFLPRFKTETTLSLTSNLQNIGMTRPFSRQLADFSGINGQRDLYISEVIHRAVVDVSEEGTEAAAVTAVVVTFKSAVSPTSEFRCDHPFLFLIRENVSRVNLFIGKFSGGK